MAADGHEDFQCAPLAASAALCLNLVETTPTTLPRIIPLPRPACVGQDASYFLAAVS